MIRILLKKAFFSIFLLALQVHSISAMLVTPERKSSSASASYAASSSPIATEFLSPTSGASTSTSSSDYTQACGADSRPSIFARSRQGLLEWWNGAACRGRRQIAENTMNLTLDTLSDNPRTSAVVGGATLLAVAAAPVTGTALAAGALASSYAAAQTEPALARLETTAQGLNTQLQRTITTGVESINAAGTQVVHQIGTEGDRILSRLQENLTTVQEGLRITAQALGELRPTGQAIIQEIGTQGTLVTQQIGAQGTLVAQQIGQTAQQQITAIQGATRTATAQINGAFANGNQQIRETAQTFFRQGIQALGLGSLAITGAIICFKNLANHINQKSTILASVGAGITAASIACAHFLFAPNAQPNRAQNAQINL